MFSRRRVHSERGETLIELLIAITILGVCVVAIGASVAGAVLVSGLHRDQADAARILHNYAEQLQGTYSNCATSYSLAQPPGFQVPSLDIAYWNGSGFQDNCPSPDQGLQRVTIGVTSVDGRVSDALTIVLRSP
jgi:type II secretory pathway pseudopilin PulG